MLWCIHRTFEKKVFGTEREMKNTRFYVNFATNVCFFQRNLFFAINGLNNNNLPKIVLHVSYGKYIIFYRVNVKNRCSQWTKFFISKKFITSNCTRLLQILYWNNNFSVHYFSNSVYQKNLSSRIKSPLLCEIKSNILKSLYVSPKHKLI